MLNSICIWKSIDVVLMRMLSNWIEFDGVMI